MREKREGKGEGEALTIPPERCECGSRNCWARMDEKKPDGRFGPGPDFRCIECKREHAGLNPHPDPRDTASRCGEDGFTPGPWGWEPPVLGFHGWRLSPGILLADGTDGTPGGDEIDRANARLMAAAPDLLEVARRAAEGWANVIELKIIAPQHVAAAEILRDEARAALSKARGGEG